jgi:site-specific DNA-methyltransferase (adenine-specific)
MRENTEHPTQKPEKLIARLVLASSKENDLILDPFGGSGTTAVVSKKLNRKFLLIEREKKYLAIARYRLDNISDEIQGYVKEGKYFLEKPAYIASLIKELKEE